MINIIKEIFISKGLECKDVSDFKICSYKEIFNYWVIIERDSLDKILDEQIELFIKAKESVKDSQFDKNANLLILHKVNSLQEFNKDDLLRLEEDPYDFKKSIIYYTEAELTKLKDKLDNPIVSSIEALILKSDVFEKHKNNYDDNDFESLLYRIANKIPFISINVKITDNLKSLEDLNQNAIREKELNGIIEKELFKLSDEEFESLSSKDLYDKLKILL